MRLFAVDTACAQNALSGQWYNFDDSSVSSITEESVVVSTVKIHQDVLAGGRRRQPNLVFFSCFGLCYSIFVFLMHD